MLPMQGIYGFDPGQETKILHTECMAKKRKKIQPELILLHQRKLQPLMEDLKCLATLILGGAVVALESGKDGGTD